MRQMKQLEKLVIVDLGAIGSKTIIDSFANGSLPQTVKVYSSLFLDEGDTWIQAPHVPDDWQKCRLESFQWTRDGGGELIEWNRFFLGLAKAPLLRKVWLTCTDYTANGTDLTEGILALLSSPTISSFRAGGVQGVKTESVCEALKTNRALTIYDFFDDSLDTEEKQSLMVEVLKSHNTTMEFVRVCTWNEACAKIKYWTNLNKSGRSKARDLSSSRSCIIQLLAKASVEVLSDREDPVGDPNGQFMEEYVSSREDSESATLKLFNCQYGLLREMPSLWSSVHVFERVKNDRQRRRGNDQV